MNILITGAAGFVGKYCIDYFKNVKKYNVYGTKMANETAVSGADFFDVDLLDKDSIKKALIKSKPSYILHLAAQSSVAVSWKNPQLTVDVNIKGSVNLLETIRELNINPKILLVGSSEEYGYISKNLEIIDENTAVNPGNIYAVTKAAQNMLGRVYAKGYGMQICMSRAFNHIGIGQSAQFVVGDFINQVVLIEKGMQEPVIKVGNLSAKRDFTDVRDVVRAYSLILEKGKAGETYNIGSGKPIEISEILQKILNLSKVKIDVQVDQNKLRPVDIPIIKADISKLEHDTGWQRKIEIDETLAEMLDFQRKNLERQEN